MAKEINPIERKISMVAAASEALTCKKKNPKLDSDRVIQHVSKNVLSGKDELTKMGMIAAASEALNIAERQPHLSDKEILRQVMGNLPGMLENIGS
ncbi:hypothetical protein HZC30_07650 [Candidatus Woesearchaeota archaeon]|nr:hypothetical protein [Candidatus Woesearchaeota archaeon]